MSIDKTMSKEEFLKVVEQSGLQYISQQHASTESLTDFLHALAAHLDKAVRGKVTLPCRRKQRNMQRLAMRLLGEQKCISQESRRKIAIWNDMLKYLNVSLAGILEMPQILVFANLPRPRAALLNGKTWKNSLQVQALSHFFLHHYKATERSDVAWSAVFSTIVSGCHFPRSYRSIAAIPFRDLNLECQYAMLTLPGRKRTASVHRYFFNSLSASYFARLAATRTELSPESLLIPKEGPDARGSHGNYKNFARWLTGLVQDFNAFYSRKRPKEPELLHPIESLTPRELLAGARVLTEGKYPVFLTTYLSRRVETAHMSEANYESFFTHGPVFYPSSCRREITIPPVGVSYESSESDEHEEAASDAAELKQIHAEVNGIMRSLPDDAQIEARRAAAGVLDGISQTLIVKENAQLSNYGLAVGFLSYGLTRQSKKKKGTLTKTSTVHDYFGTVSKVTYHLLPEVSILSLDKYELTDLVSEAMAVSPSESARRSIKKKLKSFFSYLEAIHQIPKVDWNHPDLWVYHEGQEREIISFYEFEAILEAINSIEDPHVADVFRALAILLFYGGLRIHEAAKLALEDIFVDKELNVRIQKSKTPFGKRNLPLHYLVPNKDLGFLREFVRRLKRLRGTGPLLALKENNVPDPDSLADALTAIMEQALGRHVTCHQLRHSMASWFVVRLYAFTYGTDMIAWKFKDWEHPVFWEYETDKLRRLFFGKAQQRLGDKYFTHGMRVLSRLLGHASPDTSFSIYTHTLDIIHSFFLLQEDDKTTVTRAQAANLAGISHQSALKYFPQTDNRVPITKVARYCHDKMKEKM